MEFDQVVDLITEERMFQDSIKGSFVHASGTTQKDEDMNPGDWLIIIQKYVTDGMAHVGFDTQGQMSAIRKIAALAVAAMEQEHLCKPNPIG